MAQFFTDFTGYTLDARPTDWTVRWNGVDGDWQVRTGPTGSTGGVALRGTYVAGTDHTSALSWDTIDSDPDRAQVEFYARWQGNSTASSTFRVIARASGTAGSETGYTHGVSGQNNTARRYVSGAATTITNVAESWTANTWRRTRVRINGTSMQVRTWADADTEPGTWEVSITDANISAAGWVGVFMFLSGVNNWIDVLGVGTNGDPAPTTTVTTPEGQGAGAWTYTGTGQGSTTKTGAGTGTWAHTGTGAGSTAKAGAGTGSWAYAGSGAGSSSRTGQGTGTYTWAGTGAGSTTKAGSGTGSWTYTGTGVGEAPAIAPHEGTGTGTYGWTGTGVGTTTRDGAGGGSWAYQGDGAGSRASEGAGTGSWAYEGSGEGSRTADGSGSGSWVYVGTGRGGKLPPPPDERRFPAGRSNAPHPGSLTPRRFPATIREVVP